MTVVSEPVNLVQIAKRLRVTRQTLYNWRDEGCPVDEGYEAIQAWNKARRLAAKELSEEATDAAEQKLRAEARKLLAEAEAKELKTAQLKGELLDRKEIELALSECMSTLKAKLESLPETITHDALPIEYRANAKELWEDQVRLFLIELSQLEIMPPQEDAADDSE